MRRRDETYIIKISRTLISLFCHSPFPHYSSFHSNNSHSNSNSIPLFLILTTVRCRHHPPSANVSMYVCVYFVQRQELNRIPYTIPHQTSKSKHSKRVEITTNGMLVILSLQMFIFVMRNLSLPLFHALQSICVQCFVKNNYCNKCRIIIVILSSILFGHQLYAT